MREDRIGALTHIDAAAGDLDGAIAEDADHCFARRAADRICARRNAVTDQLLAFAHRAGAWAALRPAESFSARSIGFAQAARRPRLFGVRVLFGIIEQADIERIDADLVGQFVDGAFDAEGAGVFAGRAQGSGLDRVHRHDVLARARNSEPHT